MGPLPFGYTHYVAVVPEYALLGATSTGEKFDHTLGSQLRPMIVPCPTYSDLF